jgi:tetratricopeptide (TPR) repeat protein
VASAATDFDVRVLRLEQWLKAVLHHQPGTTDEAVRAVGSWSVDELNALAIDQGVLIQLTQNLELLSTASRAPFILSGFRRIPYSAAQLRRLKVLACAAAGALEERDCVALRAAEALDPELTQLAARAAAARRRGDVNDVARRGALLHTDIAMAGPIRSQGRPADASASDGLLVRAFDGQQLDLEFPAPHWLMARALLDAVRPQHDAMVRAWYEATGTWMQQQLIADATHLAHGRTLFPEAADLWFLSGCQHERLATSAVQSLARTSVLPQGVALDIGSERSELSNAETLFRRAVALDRTFTDAHLRLGHVLLARGQFKDAAAELQLAFTRAGDRILQYFASLYLGAAQERLAQLEQARGSYRHAAELYPKAQSPRLALSALAWRRGEGETARSEMQSVTERPGAAGISRLDDPWWDYNTLPERNVDTLFDALRRPFLLDPAR